MNIGRSDLQALVPVRYVRPEGPIAMSTPAQREQLVIAGQQLALPHGITYHSPSPAPGPC